MRIIKLIIGVSLGWNLLGQNVGIGTTTPHLSSALEIESPNKGLLIPRMNQTAMLGITMPQNGLMVYNTTDSSLYTYRALSGWNRSGFELPYGTASDKYHTGYGSTLHIGYTGSNSNIGAIEGESLNGIGLIGNSVNNYGILASSQNGTALIATSQNSGNAPSLSVIGYNSALGINSISDNNIGIYGKSYSAGPHAGVKGEGGIMGVEAVSNSLNLLHHGLKATGANGIIGEAFMNGGYGVKGTTNFDNSLGVYGVVTGINSSAVRGDANGNFSRAVEGNAFGAGGIGVYGFSDLDTGVKGIGYYNGLQGTANNGTGVRGLSHKSGGYGVYGETDNSNGFGIYGVCNNNIGGTGVYGNGTQYGINGISQAGIGVIGSSNFKGVQGTGDITGVEGISNYEYGAGLKGESNGSSGFGVMGTATAPFGFGGHFYASGNSSTGLLAILGNVNGKAAGHFKTNSFNNVQVLLEETEDDYARMEFRNTNTERWNLSALPKADNNSANARMAIFYSDLDNGTGGDALILEGDGDLHIPAGDAFKPGGGPWAATSDQRLKQNITSYQDGLDIIKKISPVNFQYNALSGYDTHKKHIGIIAQDIQDIAPYMVTTNDKDYLQVDPNAFTYMLINAVKELSRENENLKMKNELLIMRNEKLAVKCESMEERIGMIEAILYNGFVKK